MNPCVDFYERQVRYGEKLNRIKLIRLVERYMHTDIKPLTNTFRYACMNHNGRITDGIKRLIRFLCPRS